MEVGSETSNDEPNYIFATVGFIGTTLQDGSSQNYVFYSHGYIVEGENPMPVNDRWGVYDFPAIKQRLSDQNYQLIATHRPANTPPFDYSQSLAAQVNALKDAGVPSQKIFFFHQVLLHRREYSI